MARLRLRVNGKMHSLEAPVQATLVEVLRYGLGLTGTKYGCGEGLCGACTVLLDGRAVKACILKASAAQGKGIVTIEGLAAGNTLHPVQQAFLDQEAFQCGYCTPGMILKAVELLGQKRAPGAEEIRQALEGHLCRCGAHPRIVAAVQQAAEENRRG